MLLYRLKSDYILRGWEKLSWALVKRPQNKMRKLTREQFEALLLCDGQTDLTDAAANGTLQKTLAECEAAGIVERSPQPAPLDPDQHYRYYHNRYVGMVFWSVTGKCNYRCRHCYMDAPGAALGELSTEEALALIDQMADCGVLRVDITGGEPFVRRDFWQLVDRIVAHKVAIGMVYTNGWLLSGSVLDAFESRGLRPEFSISFDGVGWHDWMRGIPGAEQAALRALHLCKARGFPTNVEMCLHRGNRGTLPQTVEALCAAGVGALKVGYVANTALWLHHSDGNAMTREEYLKAVIRYIPAYYKAGRPIELLFGSAIYLHRQGDYKIIAERYDGTENCRDCYICGAARYACYITPEGRLLPCMPMTSSPAQGLGLFPKVQDIGLRQGLSDSYYMRFVDNKVKDLLAANTECAACAHRYQCGGGCRANALMEGDHDLMGCDRNMCMLWKEGYVERIRKAADDAIAKYGVPSKKGGSSEVDT